MQISGDNDATGLAKKYCAPSAPPAGFLPGRVTNITLDTDCCVRQRGFHLRYTQNGINFLDIYIIILIIILGHTVLYYCCINYCKIIISIGV